MNFKEQIYSSYMDADGLVTPDAFDKSWGCYSQNGTMFTSEFHIMLHEMGLSTEEDKDKFEETIRRCMPTPGLLQRGPVCYSQEGPDNILAVTAACAVLDRPQLARDVLAYGLKSYGWFNTENIGSIYNKDTKKIFWKSFLWRQPQLLLTCLIGAKKLNILHFPLVMVAALLIFYAGLRNFKKTDSDSRRLTWLLVKAAGPVSILCALASIVWYWKLNKDYEGRGMKAAGVGYYQAGHPFLEHWVD